MAGTGAAGGGGVEGEPQQPQVEDLAVVADSGPSREGLVLDPTYVEGFVEGVPGCLERIGEDDAEGEDLLRGEWRRGIGSLRWISSRPSAR